MVQLTGDVLALICEELGNRKDFGTLFNCSLACKPFVYPALGWLYKIQHDSPIIKDDDADISKLLNLSADELAAYQSCIMSKWALLWKSIIRSTLGATFLPYALYIRMLDLRNLLELLQDNWFREFGFESFFADDMAQFLVKQDIPPPSKIAKKTRSRKKAAYTQADLPLILDAVGESITGFVYVSALKDGFEAALEEIAGDISAVALSRWTGRLSKLKSITLWDGRALDGTVAMSIASKCLGFNDLSFFSYNPTDGGDSNLASFFSSLRENSLESFEALDAKKIGPESMLALDHHSASLKSLKLDGLEPQGLKNLNLLKGCEKLEGIDIRYAKSIDHVDLEATENDVFLEVVEWLGKCVNLRDIHLALLSGPAILTHVCMANDLKLRSIAVSDYPLINNQGFHKALSHQTSLEALELTAEPEGAFGDDIEILVSSICQLKKLKVLRLVSTSEYFTSHHIAKIASQLPSLESFWFGGYDLSDQIWDAMASLPHLKSLYTFGLSSFTTEGILKFIDTLKPTNQGFVLAVMYQHPQNDLGEYDKWRIQERLTAMGGGRFDFVLYRDEDTDASDLSD